MQIGDLLNDGTALVLHQTPLYVLCFDMDKREFVTWALDDKGKTFEGHYWKSILLAVGDYKDRTLRDFRQKV
jgi:hypothetical protein